MPHVFRQYFPRLTAIIDCTEIFSDRLKSLKARAQVYSNYEKAFSSENYDSLYSIRINFIYIPNMGGRVSDVDVVRESGFFNRNSPYHGYQILEDRGFTLQDEIPAGCSMELIMSSFTKDKKQLSSKEILTSRQIATVGIHVKRVIGLIKNRYRIIDGTLPITLLKSLSDEADDCEIANIDKTFTVCAALLNMGDGIVNNEKDLTSINTIEEI